MWATTRSPLSTAASYASRVTPSARAARASRAASRLKSDAGQAAASARERPSRTARPEGAGRNARTWSASMAQTLRARGDARRFPGGRRGAAGYVGRLRGGGHSLRLVVELRQPAQLLGQVPVLLAQELHRGGQGDAAGDRRLGEDPDPEAPPGPL